MRGSRILGGAALVAVTIAAPTGASAGGTLYPHIGFPAHCHGPVYKPRTIIARCDMSVTVTGIHWHRYGGTEANGVGTEHLSNSSGSVRDYPVNVFLSRVIDCDATNQFEYLRLTLSPTGSASGRASAKFNDRYPCVL
jgi:hypothetical protein